MKGLSKKHINIFHFARIFNHSDHPNFYTQMVNGKVGLINAVELSWKRKVV